MWFALSLGTASSVLFLKEETNVLVEKLFCQIKLGS